MLIDLFLNFFINLGISVLVSLQREFNHTVFQLNNKFYECYKERL